MRGFGRFVLSLIALLVVAAIIYDFAFNDGELLTIVLHYLKILYDYILKLLLAIGQKLQDFNFNTEAFTT